MLRDHPETGRQPLSEQLDSGGFEPINRGYNSVFRSGHLSLGLVAPLENYPPGSRPSMNRRLERVRLAETLGFAAVWLRDVPFEVRSFGDTRSGWQATATAG